MDTLTIDKPVDEIAEAKAAKLARQRRDFIDGLRMMADFFEANPELPKPIIAAVTIFAWAENRTAIKTILQADETRETTHGFTHVRQFGGVEIQLFEGKSCKQVQQGTHIVEKWVPKQPIEWEFREIEEPLMVTVCEGDPAFTPQGA